MNKLLLLALLFIPLIAGCEANSTGSAQAGEPVDDSVASDIGPAPDSGDPNFSIVTNTAPVIEWKVIHYECKTTEDEDTSTPEVIATGIDWNPIVITGSRYPLQTTKAYMLTNATLDSNGNLAIQGCVIGDKGTVVLGY
jgi:hypothetical protein